MYLLSRLFEMMFLPLIKFFAKKRAEKCVNDIDTPLLTIKKQRVVEDYVDIRVSDTKSIIERLIAISVNSLILCFVWLLFINSTYTFGFNFITIILVFFCVHSIIDLIFAVASLWYIIRGVIDIRKALSLINNFHDSVIHEINKIINIINDITELKPEFGEKSLNSLKLCIDEYNKGKMLDNRNVDYFITRLKYMMMNVSTHLNELKKEKEEADKNADKIADKLAAKKAEEERLEAERIAAEMSKPASKIASKPVAKPSARPVTRTAVKPRAIPPSKTTNTNQDQSKKAE